MKTRTTILAALLFSVFFGINANASGDNPDAKATRSLKRQIQKEFSTLPLSDIANLEETNYIELRFRVKEDQSIEVLHIDGENKDLIRHANMLLRKNHVVADESLVGNAYRVDMKFVDKD